jgi:hypothetical protein
MRVSTRRLMRASTSIGGLIAIVLLVGFPVHSAQNQGAGHPTIATEADFRRAMKELSNWGRWGDDDELGAANLITPAKRKQALALAKEGRTVSLAHDVAQERPRMPRTSSSAFSGMSVRPAPPIGTNTRARIMG